MNTSKKEVIRTSSNVMDLIGVGEEWLLDRHGNVLAVFQDGMIKGGVSRPSGKETTVVHYDFSCDMCAKTFTTMVPLQGYKLCEKCQSYALECESDMAEIDALEQGTV